MIIPFKEKNIGSAWEIFFVFCSYQGQQTKTGEDHLTEADKDLTRVSVDLTKANENLNKAGEDLIKTDKTHKLSVVHPVSC